VEPPSAVQALNTTQQGVKVEGEKSCSDSTGDHSEETTTTERIRSKTREELLQLMEETSEEMRRAKSMMLGYQEASHGLSQVPPLAGVSSQQNSTSTIPSAGQAAEQMVVPREGRGNGRLSATSEETGSEKKHENIADPEMKLSAVMSDTHLNGRTQEVVADSPQVETPKPNPSCSSA